MLGRLRRTSQFIALTTFGNTVDANLLIERVKRIHLRVNGIDNSGKPYAASDPQLLAWVHVAETSRFLAAYLRYKNPQLSRAEQDRYYQEAALIAQALGASQLPRSVQAVEDYLQAMRAVLVCDERTREVMRLLINAPAPSWQAKPAMRVMLNAGIGLLPAWAQQQIQQSPGPLAQWLVDKQMVLIARLLRRAIQRGVCSRAMQRMGR